MIFKSNKHRQYFEDLERKLEANGYRRDDETRPVLYLIALLCSETECGLADEMFDFADRKIKPEVIDAPWQTSSSLKLTRLAFSLWNGFPGDENPSYCNVYWIFGNEWDPYFIQAIKLRFPYTCEE